MVGATADGVDRTTTMLPEGYGKIWATIYQKEGLDVRFGVEIPAGGIDRQLGNPDAPVRVTYSAGGAAPVTEEFDFLLYTAALQDGFLNKKFVSDATAEEARIFSTLKGYVLATTLYRSDWVADYSDQGRDAPIMYNADKMDNRTMDGGWYADRNDPRIFSPSMFGPRNFDQTRVGYQFYEDPCAADEVLCETDRSPDPARSPPFYPAPNVLKKFHEEMAVQKINNVKVLDQYPFPYFFHFPRAAVDAGMPWDLVNLQGKSKTWYLGASTCFESVHDVTNYNLMILKKYLGVDVKGDGVRTREARDKALASLR